MKYVRTARGYESLRLDEKLYADGTVQEVSEANAKKLEAAGTEHGITVLVFDTEEEALEETAGRYSIGSRSPDLSEGVGAITGNGPAVQTLESPEAPAEESAPAPTASRAAGDKNQEK